MQIAIASGKGGTGKTTIAVNLANMISHNGETVWYADCDVEEPNGHLFLRPIVETSETVALQVPVVDTDTCIACGKCAEICQYSAIVMLAGMPVVFSEMCHACGGCVHVCPVGAITEQGREIGIIEIGHSNGIKFIHGRLSIGNALSPPLIRAVKKRLTYSDIIIRDCPPGTSCPVVTAVTGADVVVLVTEPTPFGLNDLWLAVDMVRALGIPFGVFINRSDNGNDDVRTYCHAQGVPILGELPDDRHIAEAYSCGTLLTGIDPAYDDIFTTLYHSVASLSAESQ